MNNPLNIGVSNVNRSPGGARYTITRNDDSRVYGYIEVTLPLADGHPMENVRDEYDNPVRVGSVKYELLRAAVKAYQSWAERHQCEFGYELP